MQLAELTFTVREMGPAESHADSYFLLAADGGPPVAFVGDLAFHGTHPYTADGHSASWLAALDLLAGNSPASARCTPGTVPPPGRACSPSSAATCSIYRELVRRLADGEPRLPEAAKAELDAGMQSFLPDAPLTWMIGLGADAVAAELARAEAG